MLKSGFVYIISNRLCTTLYIGVTANLKTRVSQHKNGTGSAFTAKYNLTYLLYYEQLFDIRSAIKREKQLKNWHRDWKFNLIRDFNPGFVDLFDQL
ncbi:MAG: GIY-YIG nuclease family protein [Bacteroidetes bacterium]|nr:MAG: GIY-YIG nuclease family protein [Bacteroidota bacterium]